jgi:1,4-dihydroxy-6-naphthoate synthase
MGDQYGPKLISKQPIGIDDLKSAATVIAVPGTRTSAFGALNLMLGQGAFRHQVVPFEQIIDRVSDGTFAAGLVIHEGQLTFADHGLHLSADMGAWWSKRSGLPLPLGVNVIRRDLERLHGPGTLREVTATLSRSVRHAMDNREEGIAYARKFGRGINAQLTDQFVSMYVNRWTLDFGPTGERAVHAFLDQLHSIGLTPESRGLEIIMEVREPGESTLASSLPV